MSVTTASREPVPAQGQRRRPLSRRRLRLLVVFVLLVGAIVYLLVEGLGSSLDYFDTVTQALAHKAQIGTTELRLEGVVVPGTVHRTTAGAEFEVSGGGQRIVVHNSGSPPGLFQPDIPVVVVGHFLSSGSDLFVSDQIMVKHSATYIAAHPARVRGPSGKIAR
ncbi:MAG: cytochrome c maturation protein CcmE [Acidimicrobiales bacterium]